MNYDTFYTIDDNVTVHYMFGATTASVTNMIFRFFGINATDYGYKVILKPMVDFISFQYAILKRTDAMKIIESKGVRQPLIEYENVANQIRLQMRTTSIQRLLSNRDGIIQGNHGNASNEAIHGRANNFGSNKTKGKDRNIDTTTLKHEGFKFHTNVDREKILRENCPELTSAEFSDEIKNCPKHFYNPPWIMDAIRRRKVVNLTGNYSYYQRDNDALWDLRDSAFTHRRIIRYEDCANIEKHVTFVRTQLINESLLPTLYCRYHHSSFSIVHALQDMGL